MVPSVIVNSPSLACTPSSFSSLIETLFSSTSTTSLVSEIRLLTAVKLPAVSVLNVSNAVLSLVTSVLRLLISVVWVLTVALVAVIVLLVASSEVWSAFSPISVATSPSLIATLVVVIPDASILTIVFVPSVYIISPLLSSIIGLSVKSPNLPENSDLFDQYVFSAEVTVWCSLSSVKSASSASFSALFVSLWVPAINSTEVTPSASIFAIWLPCSSANTAEPVVSFIIGAFSRSL